MKMIVIVKDVEEIKLQRNSFKIKKLIKRMHAESFSLCINNTHILIKFETLILL